MPDEAQYVKFEPTAISQEQIDSLPQTQANTLSQRQTPTLSQIQTFPLLQRQPLPYPIGPAPAFSRGQHYQISNISPNVNPSELELLPSPASQNPAYFQFDGESYHSGVPTQPNMGADQRYEYETLFIDTH
jgi:hypothetical protein